MTARSDVVTLLVVDDDDVEFEGIVRTMRQRRITNPVVNARDGIEALEILRGQHAEHRIKPPFIVLLDLNMPRMNGLEFLRALRADPALGDTVVFVLTTSDHHEDRARAYREHVAGYMVKEHVGTDFNKAVELLGQYWTTVTLPSR